MDQTSRVLLKYGSAMAKHSPGTGNAYGGGDRAGSPRLRPLKCGLIQRPPLAASTAAINLPVAVRVGG
jgi:hypothetical protein